MMVEPDVHRMNRRPPRVAEPKQLDLATVLGYLDDMPEVMQIALVRALRAVLVWPLASWLLARDPIAHPNHLALGLLIALMSCSGMTKWVASAIIGVLLLLVIVPGEAVQRAFAALV